MIQIVDIKNYGEMEESTRESIVCASVAVKSGSVEWVGEGLEKAKTTHLNVVI